MSYSRSSDSSVGLYECVSIVTARSQGHAHQALTSSYFSFPFSAKVWRQATRRAETQGEGSVQQHSAPCRCGRRLLKPLCSVTLHFVAYRRDENWQLPPSFISIFHFNLGPQHCFLHTEPPCSVQHMLTWTRPRVSSSFMPSFFRSSKRSRETA